MAFVLVMILLSYLAGSIPTSLIVGKLLGGVDIREHGSGNAGATNVYRVLGLGPALVVSAVDIGKGLVAVLLISRIGEMGVLAREWAQILGGVAAIAGHVWTAFAGFRGGKGVNTAAGVLVALAPWATLIALFVWAAVTWATRYVSVGSMCAALALPAVLLAERFALDRAVSTPVLILACVVGALILVTHRSNLGRLLRGQENRLGGGGRGRGAGMSEKKR